MIQHGFAGAAADQAAQRCRGLRSNHHEIAVFSLSNLEYFHVGRTFDDGRRPGFEAGCEFAAKRLHLRPGGCQAIIMIPHPVFDGLFNVGAASFGIEPDRDRTAKNARHYTGHFYHCATGPGEAAEHG